MRTGPRSLLALTLVLLATSAAHARVFVGVGFGLPIYGGPYYGYYRPYPYYPYPYGVYVTPPPVVVGASPVGQPVPVAPAAPAPVPTYAPPGNNPGAPPAVPTPEPLPNAPMPIARSVAPNAGGVANGLNSSDEGARAAALVQLGRNKDSRAVVPLTRALRDDRSAAVREAAARGLGLLGAPAALPALQHAAQADDDRDVRRSASFAAEVIRANMPR